MTREEINFAIERTKDIIKFNGYQTYSSYSFICGCSNENQEAIAKLLNYKSKDILTVAASGEQYFSAKFAGAKNVTLYDINNLSKLYVYLKIGGMKTLNYEDFINFFNSKQNKEQYMSLKTLLKISDYLPDYISEYWYHILKQFSYYDLRKLISYPTDFSGNEYQLKQETYYRRKNYEELKKIIQNEKYPEFINASIYDIINNINSKKFDVIDTSNIIECIISDSWNLDSYSDDLLNNWIYFIENKLSKLLNKNGQIIVDYEPSIYSKELISHKSFKKYKVQSKTAQKEKSLVLVYTNKNN